MAPSRSKGRGHYDRALSPSQRAQQQRVLIYEATLELLAAAPESLPRVNVEAICAATGLGRNTVYGQFETSAALVDTCLEEALQACNACLDQTPPATTPLDALRLFVERWTVLLTLEPKAVLALMRCRRSALVHLAQQHLGDVLQRGAAAGTFARDFEAVRLPLLAETCVGMLALGDAVDPLHLASTLTDLLSRAAR